MLSPSRGFCCCFPVKVGALVVCLLSFVGSGILAGITINSLTTISTHITPIQTAGLYLTSLSWVVLTFFSLLGFISVIIQHPLALAIFARFVFYHIPAGLVCNLFFTIVSFYSYRSTDAVLRSSACTQASHATPICIAFASLETLTWVYLFLLLPACIFQSYVYVIIKRFIFVVSGEWVHQREEYIERQRRSVGMAGLNRRSAITQEIGAGGRRRAKALWLTMETSTSPVSGDDSFLPSMIISPMDFTYPPKTPSSVPSSAGLLSPTRSPKYGKKTTKPSLFPLPESSSEFKNDKSRDRSANMDMDFSDPDSVTTWPHSREWRRSATTPRQVPGEQKVPGEQI